MPTIYGAGTADANGFLSGIAIPTVSDLLPKLKQLLTSAGQTITDEIATNNRIIARGVDQGDFCYKIYSVELVSGIEYKLTLRGDLDNTGTNLSPDVISIPVFNNGNALLYLAADEGSECITIINPNLASEGIHAGWLEKRRLVDKGAWMVGYLDFWMTNSFFAKDVNNTVWAEAKRYFYSAAESFTAPTGCYTFLWDACTSHTGATTASLGATSHNYKPYVGAVDPISFEPKLLPYGYAQGATSYNTYSTTIDASYGRGLYLPGFVQFARTGLGYLNAGEQKKDGTKVFISAGHRGTTGQTGFQGFQIAG